MKILVGLSGGVDSAVCAYLLKKQGHDVTCCFMRNWDSLLNNDIKGNNTLNQDICTQEKDYNDALSVANTLGLKLIRNDYIKEYWNEVFQTFIDEYAKGRTPNPDILCNKHIKFKHFLDFANENGFDYIATGHYFKSINNNGIISYYKADDLNKDQSYFLAEVKKESLDKCLFPLSNITKQEVRQIALELNLDIAKKKDSTGVCFIGERNFKQFLSNYIPMKTGLVIDIDLNKVIGQHDGVFYYTIGQRKGFNIGGKNGPYFCVAKDVVNNLLILTNNNNTHYLNSNKCKVININWLDKPKNNSNIQVKFRYRQNDNDCKIEYIDENNVYLHYPQIVKSVAIGQEAVMYDNSKMLGGGIIDVVYLNDEDINLKLIKKAKQICKI